MLMVLFPYGKLKIKAKFPKFKLVSAAEYSPAKPMGIYGSKPCLILFVYKDLSVKRRAT